MIVFCMLWSINVGASTDHKLCTFGLLLRDLLGLHSRLVHLAEGELSDRDIIQDDVEEARTLSQDPEDVFADYLTHCEELAGIVLGHDALKRLLWGTKSTLQLQPHACSLRLENDPGPYA